MSENEREASWIKLWVSVVVAVFAVWWLTFGRTTPFPSIWRGVPTTTSLALLLLAGGLVTVLLAVLAIRGRRSRAIGPLGAGTWFVLSVWSARHGDDDGLWALAIPVYVFAAIAMSTVVEVARLCASRRSSRSPTQG